MSPDALTTEGGFVIFVTEGLEKIPEPSEKRYEKNSG